MLNGSGDAATPENLLEKINLYSIPLCAGAFDPPRLTHLNVLLYKCQIRCSDCSVLTAALLDVVDRGADPVDFAGGGSQRWLVGRDQLTGLDLLAVFSSDDRCLVGRFKLESDGNQEILQFNSHCPSFR
jgi:hypothetical protein